MNVDREGSSRSRNPSFPETIAAISLAVAALYVGSYVALSAAGRYVPRPSGERRYENGLTLLDRHEWRPAGVVWYRWRSVTGDYTVEGEPAGWFYLPLLLIDRGTFHPTLTW